MVKTPQIELQIRYLSKKTFHLQIDRSPIRSNNQRFSMQRFAVVICLIFTDQRRVPKYFLTHLTEESVAFDCSVSFLLQIRKSRAPSLTVISCEMISKSLGEDQGSRFMLHGFN